ncbi:MAG TPA: hypothetical protein VK612_07795 [Pyrinomonadaceae bacterium]|nr:hypothetical protein [Pyrinomonadaceae bacterium]
MRLLCITSLLFSLLLACQGSAENSIQVTNASNTASQPTNTLTDKTDKKVNEIWSPTAIEECMTKVKVGESIEFETDFNPFYLRADFDGNSHVDYAVLVKGKDSNKRGLVICKDSNTPFIFGSLSKPKTPLSSFEDDNFITNQWEISTKEYTKSMVGATNRKIAPDAKGESITFAFEGGNGVNIYWDGKQFRIGE